MRANPNPRSLLHYETDTSTPSWGFSVCDKDRRYEWFKLEQDPNYTRDTLRRNYPKTTIAPGSSDEVERLITDFLKLIRSHAEQEIRKEFEVRSLEFSRISWGYIITVPAMWPEPAQNVTLRSAHNAGMDGDTDIKIIAEPEAAGFYGLRTVASGVGKENDTFMICDAGGGYVPSL